MTRSNTPPVGGVARVSQRVMNLAHMLTQAARRLPGSPALVAGDRLIDWATLDREVDALAAALAARGVRKGDRILVHSRNCPELVLTQFAAFRLGAVWVPTNFRISPDEAAWLARSSGASVFFVQAEFAGHLGPVRAAVPGPLLIIGMDPGAPGDAALTDLLDEGAERPVRAADVEVDDPCWFFFTSGTTGKPKAAVLTHGQMGFVITNHLADLMPGLREHTDASLVVAPLSHGAGIHFLVQVARGVKTVLTNPMRFDPEEVWSLIEQHRITNLFTVPTIVNMMVDDPAVDRHDHSSLRHLIYAGAPMYREDQKRALGKLGKVLVQYFGLGEVTGNITVLPPDLHSLEDDGRPNTCGFERSAMQISIQDEQGRELPAGEQGEICVCGPAVFAGYYDNPEANAKAFRDGWFRTGDLGMLDARGFLTITGRASDMYISGGSNVYPREIEEKVLTHPAIAEVAVLGMPDRRWGEVGLMICVPAPGTQIDADELLAWMTPLMARYKLPRRILFWDELPRSGYGKIAKRLIRERLQALGEWPTIDTA
ncbi:MAG: acyl-CoA synthetase [Burkholderiaceae bacterium]